MMMISVRKMKEEEIPRVSELLCACYRWIAPKEGFTDDELKGLLEFRGSRETVRKESQQELYLVACKRKLIVGMVALRDNEITKFYVDPEYHRQGIGAVLFRASEQIIRKKSYADMFLYAIGTTPIPFYQAMGMSLVGHKKGHSGRHVARMKKTFFGVSPTE